MAEETKPTCVIVIGMAGSGKTTLMQRIATHLGIDDVPNYIVNLDPAVTHVPYPANIDIRDTVNYKSVMKEYGLGPNGGILTALNLFTTRFDQVLGFLEKRAPDVKYMLLDTPGQIEIFTWSASGAIITEAIAATFPTVVVYVIDTPRTSSPTTFISNMLYACSIMYKTRLPFIIAFNKTDVLPHDFAVEWMTDFESFEMALSADEHAIGADLSRSMCLALDEFYCTLKSVGVSAVTGAGMDELFEAIDAATVEYETEYKPEFEKAMAERAAKEAEEQDENLAALRAQIDTTKGRTVVLDGNPSAATDPGESDDDSSDEEIVADDVSKHDGTDASFDVFLARNQ